MNEWPALSELCHHLLVCLLTSRPSKINPPFENTQYGHVPWLIHCNMQTEWWSISARCYVNPQAGRNPTMHFNCLEEHSFLEDFLPWERKCLLSNHSRTANLCVPPRSQHCDKHNDNVSYSWAQNLQLYQNTLIFLLFFNTTTLK